MAISTQTKMGRSIEQNTNHKYEYGDKCTDIQANEK